MDKITSLYSTSVALIGSIVCESINHYGTEAQKQNYLSALARGEYIGAFALTEPHAGSDPVMQHTTAERDGDVYILNGNKRFITSGRHSGLVIVTAKTAPAERHKGISAFLVEKKFPGISVGREEDKMGLRASDTTDLIFENCQVPVENRLGREGEGFKIAMAALDGGPTSSAGVPMTHTLPATFFASMTLARAMAAPMPVGPCMLCWQP